MTAVKDIQKGNKTQGLKERILHVKELTLKNVVESYLILICAQR